MKDPDDEFELHVKPVKFDKRHKHFIIMPFKWLEALTGASGQTFALAIHILYRGWRNGGASFKLGSGRLKVDNIPRTTKWRALRDLESRKLISVQRRGRRSPTITIRK